VSSNDKRKIITENNIEIFIHGEKEMKAIAKMLHGIRIKIAQPHSKK
jgi:hypothetical protein